MFENYQIPRSVLADKYPKNKNATIITAVLMLEGLISLQSEVLLSHSVRPICTNIDKAFNTAEIVISANGWENPLINTTIPAAICAHKKEQ